MDFCYLCHSSEVIHRFDIGHYPLLHCKACGLEWLCPQPDDAVLGEIYSSQYHENRMQSAGVGYSAMKEKTFKNILSEANIPPQATVLDVGCAEGDLLRVLQGAGHRVYGIEYSSYAAGLCAKEFGHDKIHCGELKDAPFPDIIFDAIFLMDVLEHTRDPLNVLKDVHRRLKPNGIVVLSLPNVASLSRRLMYKTWPHYLIEHLFYFSPKTIALALQQTEFRIMLQKPFNKPLSLDYLTGLLVERPKRSIRFIWRSLRAILKWFPKAMTQKLLYLPCGQMLIMAKKG